MPCSFTTHGDAAARKAAASRRAACQLASSGHGILLTATSAPACNAKHGGDIIGELGDKVSAADVTTAMFTKPNAPRPIKGPGENSKLCNVGRGNTEESLSGNAAERALIEILVILV